MTTPEQGPTTSSDVPAAQAVALEGAAVPNPSGPPSPSYPADIEISYPEELRRFSPLYQWFLVIPHWIVLLFVWLASSFVSIYAFFVVLFTGRWPRGAFDFMVGTARWTYRVVAYHYTMTNVYPPFSLEDDPAYPVRLEIEYPEHIARWRPLVAWLLVIPYALATLFVAAVTGFAFYVLLVTVLFTKKVPRGVFEAMVPGFRWYARATAYGAYMTERYPPWVWG